MRLLRASHRSRVALAVLTDSPTFATKNFDGQPYLDVCATYDEERSRVGISAVNRRKEGDIIGSVELEEIRAKSGGRLFLITGANPEAQNTFQNSRAVRPSGDMAPRPLMTTRGRDNWLILIRSRHI